MYDQTHMAQMLFLVFQPQAETDGRGWALPLLRPSPSALAGFVLV